MLPSSSRAAPVRGPRARRPGPLAERDPRDGSGSATARACSAAAIGTGAPKRCARPSSASATAAASVRRPECASASAAVVRHGASEGFDAPLLETQGADLHRVRVGALEVAFGQPQARPGVTRADLPDADPGAPSRRCSRSSSCASSNAPRSASAVTRTSTAPPVKTLTSPSHEVQHEPRVVLGLGHVAAPQRELGGVARVRRAQADGAARHGVLVQRGERAGRPAGDRSSPASARSARRRSAGRPRSSSRSPSRASSASAAQASASSFPRFHADPRPVREDHPRQQRVGGAGVRDRRHAPRALGVAGGDDHQRVERRRLDRQPHVGIALAGQFALDQACAEAVVVGLEQAQRGEAGQDLDPSGAVAHLVQRLAQAPADVGQPGVERRACSAAPAARRGRRRRALRPARARDRPPRRAARPRRAAADAARTQRSLTSGSACGAHASRWLATSPRSAPAATSARAVSRCSCSRRCATARRRSPSAISPCAKRSPSAASRPAAISASRAEPRSPSATPATAATTCGRVPSPITASASATPRSRGHSSATRRRTKCARATGGASWRLVDRRRPVRGDLPGELAEQPRVAAAARWQAWHRSSSASGASARTSCARARRVRGRGSQHRRRARGAEQAQDVRGGVGIVGARRDHDQQRQVLDPPREVRQHLQRRAVGPLRVVDHEHQRPAARRAPRTTTARCGPAASGSRRPGAARLQQQLAGRRRGAVEQVRALCGRALAHGRLEQRAHDAEGEVALERPGRRAADEAAGLDRERRARFEQRRLAHARRGLEHDDRARARRGTPDAGSASTSSSTSRSMSGA